MPKTRIASRLQYARNIFEIAASDAAVQADLALVGYTAEVMAEGRALFTACQGERSATRDARGQKLSATQAVENHQEQVRQLYTPLAQITRVVFANDLTVLERLGVRPISRVVPKEKAEEEEKPRRRTLNDRTALLDRAQRLYDELLTDQALQTVVARVGYPPARLQEERAVVSGLEQAMRAQQQRKAKAKAHIDSQRAALQELDEWLRRFKRLMKIAFRNRPELLNQLGLLERSKSKKDDEDEQEDAQTPAPNAASKTDAPKAAQPPAKKTKRKTEPKTASQANSAASS